MYIGPHVHFRDGKQGYKETIAHGLHVAELAGYTAVFEMPNTSPPVVDEEGVLWRLDLARRAESPVWFGLYLGLTGNPEQVKRAVDIYRRYKQVVGFKLFAGCSVGDLAVIDPDEQFGVYRTLAEEEYMGIIAVHSEKESLMDKNKFDPKNPITHSYARPPEAEVESIKEQIQFCKDADFMGGLHIPHISVPEGVDLVYECQEDYDHGFDVSCGVCPHHFALDNTYMNSEHGIILKMNPPLRPPEMKEGMLQRLLEGKIDWIETDHAPHTLEEKLGHPYMSGITGIQKMNQVLSWLKEKGATEDQIKDWTFNNIKQAFELDLELRECSPTFHLEHKYEFDPYAGTGVFE